VAIIFVETSIRIDTGGAGHRNIIILSFSASPTYYQDQKSMNPCLASRQALRGFCIVFITLSTILKPLRGMSSGKLSQELSNR